MQVAPVFYKFAHYVFDASPDHSWGHREMIDLALNQLREPGELDAIKASIDTLLAGGVSDEDLNRLWRGTNANIHFRGSGTRLFLTEAQRFLAERLSRGDK